MRQPTPRLRDEFVDEDTCTRLMLNGEALQFLGYAIDRLGDARLPDTSDGRNNLSADPCLLPVNHDLENFVRQQYRTACDARL